MKSMPTLLRILAVAFFPLTVTACIWDAKTLSHEKSRSHDLAETILGAPPAPENPDKLRAIIKDLEASRHEDDPNWWNNLAGAYLRLNQPEAAVKLLEPVVQKFPGDYGIHANLGTAYHLMGRYADAEKEIARDLEINPNAHFGLEKYHLALLQYLSRDAKYQARHVYVDEFTAGFLTSSYGGQVLFDRSDDLTKAMAEGDYTNGIAEAEADLAALVKIHSSNDLDVLQATAAVAALEPPPYRAKWNLAADANFEAGVIYMAQMNPKEPACATMLGLAAWSKRDYHLAVAAFEKSIVLGSPQADLLKKRTDSLKEYIAHSLRNNPPGGPIAAIILVLLIPLLILYYIYSKIRDHYRAVRVPKPM